MVLKVVIQQSTFNITYTFACVQIRHNPLSGGYCGEVPPLPIPNREVKLTCADGTTMQCGRVGSRLLLFFSLDYESSRGFFVFTRIVLGSRRFRRWTQLLLPFYLFTFLPLLSTLPFSVKNYGESSLVMFMYKMLMNYGFSFIKSAKLRAKMFLSTKKLRKSPQTVRKP